jgi:urea transport system permease protein
VADSSSPAQSRQPPLLAALGLAITFGVMGVINMAHGELLMVGAYATYFMQTLFRAYLPEYVDWYLLAAIPVAFLAAALVGMLLERTVIRRLYGRPLETLLATWGLSLILIQAARMLFGAQNVEVANPVWMSAESCSRIWCCSGEPHRHHPLRRVRWGCGMKTRLGSFVRAVTQNRRWRAAVGVRHARRLCRFGLGGIAGLAAWRCRRSATSAPTWGRAISSIPSWWWCWAASGNWPARCGRRSAWAW